MNDSTKKRPYYIAPEKKSTASSLLADLKRALGFGKAVVKRPSDETMKRIG